MRRKYSNILHGVLNFCTVSKKSWFVCCIGAALTKPFMSKLSNQKYLQRFIQINSQLYFSIEIMIFFKKFGQMNKPIENLLQDVKVWLQIKFLHF
jgi:hypothetical protein